MAWYRCGGTPSEVLSLPTPSEASGAIARFNTDLTENLLSAVAEFSASQASGTPTPSTPIPIVGVDKVSITDCGKNLCGGSRLLANAQAYLTGGTTDTQNKTFTFNANATTTSGLSFTSGIKFKENTAYTFILACSKSNTNVGTNIRFSYTDGTSANLSLNEPITADTKYIKAFTSNSAKTLDRIIKTNQSGTITLYYDECGIFEGDIEVTDFEPYNGTTAIINLGGTYYGGEVDAVTGKITLTMSEPKDLSELTWRTTSSPHIFYATFTGKKAGYDSKIVCEQYSFYNGYFTGLANNQISGNSTYPYIYVRNDDCTTDTDITEALEGCMCCCELATPLVVYASNTAEIPTIVGDNQVFADSGNIAVKFFETVGHKI